MIEITEKSVVLSEDEYRRFKIIEAQWEHAIDRVSQIFQPVKDQILPEWDCRAGINIFDECVKLAKEYKKVKKEHSLTLKHFGNILSYPIANFDGTLEEYLKTRPID